MAIIEQATPPWMDENGNETAPMTQGEIAESLGLSAESTWKEIKKKIDELRDLESNQKPDVLEK